MSDDEIQYGYANEVLLRTRVAHALKSLTVQVSALVFLVGLLLWTTLFSSYAPVHDGLHALRHALYLIPCH